MELHGVDESSEWERDTDIQGQRETERQKEGRVQGWRGVNRRWWKDMKAIRGGTGEKRTDEGIQFYM